MINQKNAFSIDILSFFNKTSYTKVWIRFVYFAVFATVGWGLIAYFIIDNQVEASKSEKYVEVSKEMKRELDLLIKEKQESILLITFSMSQNIQIIEALLNNNPSLDLHKLSLKLRENTTLKNIGFQVITPDGRSFYRSWTDKRGDDLTKVRVDIAKMIKDPKITSSTSTGKFDLTFKSMVPIYQDEKLIGIIEALSKFNSISIKMLNKGYDNVFLVDKKYKKQLSHAFTKKFVGDYYVANLNAKKELMDYIAKGSVESFLNIDTFYINDNNQLITTFNLADIYNKPMAYFILFNNLDSVDLESSVRVRDRLTLLFIIVYIFIMGFIYYIYVKQYKHFVEGLNKHLEDTVAEKTVELKEKSEILQHLAHHDSLTGLPNRLLFLDRLKQSIKRAKRDKSTVTVLFLDLDRFKEVNDTFGHDIGDKLLKIVTSRLKSDIREEDTVARLGGDEFTIILNDIEENKVIEITNSIIKKMQEAITINDKDMYTTFSIGVSNYPEDGNTPEVLLRNADTAMYGAKEKGKNRYQFYNAKMTKRALERVTLESNLRRAIEHNEFVTYFQPKINSKTDKVIGMEALVRWIDPKLGLIPPDKFIPLAEELGLIIEIDEWMMRNCIDIIMQWQKEGLEIGVVSLNLSMAQLEDPNFLTNLQNVLNDTGVDTQYLELEITEGQIMKEPELAIEVLNKIKKLGIKISVDDFGIGYSSLSYLKRLPIDKLKIDRSFIVDAYEKEDDASIVRAIIALANSLKLDYIAEGVETIEQRDFLAKEGCYNIQGYFYSKPLSVLDYKEFLIQRKQDY